MEAEYSKQEPFKTRVIPCHFLIILLLFPCVVIYGQQPAFRHYTVANGLESPTVYSSLQDDKGYMWFATESGVNRYNGRTFESFSVDDGLADNEIFRICQDQYRRIWFLSFNGKLSYYRDGKIYNETNSPFLKNAYTGKGISSMTEDGKGKLWISFFDNEIIQIDNERIKKFRFEQRKSVAGAVNVFINSEGVPEFSVMNDIYRYDESRNEIVPDRKCDFTSMIHGRCTSETNTSFAVVDNGILRLENDSTQLLIQIPHSDFPFYFVSVYIEKSGLLWAGTLESGVELYQIEKDTCVRVGRYLENLQVSDIRKDREGNFWICTKDDGVFMLPAAYRSLTIYSGNEDVKAKNLYAVFNDSKGVTWVGGEHGSVFTILPDGTPGKSFRLGPEQHNNYRVIDILEDHENNIWFATSSNTHKIDSNGKITQVGSTGNRLRGPKAGKGLAIDKQGNVYLAFFAGITKYNRQHNAFDLLPHQDYPTRPFSIAADGDRLLVSNINGLCEYKNDSLYALYHNDARLRGRMEAISSLDDSTIALASSGNGTFIYKNDTISRQITTADGLPSNDCKNLFVRGGFLYIITDKGYVKYNPLTGRVIPEVHSAMINNAYGNDIREMDINGQKNYFATSRGLVVMDETKFPGNSIIPEVKFLSFEANNMNKPIDSVISLKYDENYLKITYEAVSFTDPAHMVYGYKSDNKSNKWEQTNSNEIVLPMLSPGDYDFYVKAKTGSGEWGPASVLHFTIQKPFWKTFFFRLAVLFLIVSLVITPFMMIYNKRIRERAIELEKLQAVNRERQRISYDLHDDLGSSLTSISMNAGIIREKYSRKIEFNRELNDISQESGAAIDKMSDIVWAISVSKDHLASLASYIIEFISAFEHRTGITCTKKIDVNLDFISLRPEVR